MKEKKKLSLPITIFIGMALGIVAGLIFAYFKLGSFTTEWIKPIGTIYVNLLKFLVVPVVLFSIADGVVSLNDLKRVGSVGIKTFIYYMLTTAIAVVIGLVLVNIFKGAFTPLPLRSWASWRMRPRRLRPSCRRSSPSSRATSLSRWSRPICCLSS